jgi:hypothetical protein
MQVILYYSPYQSVVHGGIVYRKKPQFLRVMILAWWEYDQKEGKALRVQKVKLAWARKFSGDN